MFYTGGVLRGLDKFMEKVPAVGFLLNKVLRRDSSPGVFFFFVDFVVFLGAPAL